MAGWFAELDELLRGQRTLPKNLLEGRIDLRLSRFVPLGILLGATYGFFMGWYSFLSRDPAEYRQLLAAIIKLPALFFITLVVTFPSLYVFNALLGSRLRFADTLRLLIAAIVVNVAVAASLGPILGFFSFSTTSYPFMIILNVILLALAGAVGLGFLLQVLRRMSQLNAPIEPVRKPAASFDPQSGAPRDVDAPESGPQAFRSTSYSDNGESTQIFRVWVIIYGLVGAQTGWLLRPFIGSPDLPFELFRNREGNFFQSVWAHFQALLSG